MHHAVLSDIFNIEQGVQKIIERISPARPTLGWSRFMRNEDTSRPDKRKVKNRLRDTYARHHGPKSNFSSTIIGLDRPLILNIAKSAIRLLEPTRVQVLSLGCLPY